MLFQVKNGWFMLSSKKKHDNIHLYSTKKCPYCYTMLKLDAKQCDICKKKVGAINKVGFAEKRVDWKAYITAVLAWTAFIVYVWWAFFRN
jgi:hypothetical protein